MATRRKIVAGAVVVAIAVALSALGAGCQVALRANDETIPCDLPPGAKCPGSDLTCQGGFCRVCVATEEKCNGIDDDCDGVVDNGFDKDGDGFKTCGEAGQIDCNDDPATGKNVHPGAEEKCNGIDDNCDGRVDEAPNDCGEGLECWSAKGACTIAGDCRIHGCSSGGCDPDTGTCTQADCVQLGRCPEPTQVCDTKLRRCVRIVDFGETCDDAVRCRPPAQCNAAAIVNLVGRSDAFCTKTCCVAEDCPDGAICRQASNGAALCVRATDVGLTVGTKPSFATCVRGNECRSGVCGATGRCVDGCCGALTCGAGGTCAFGTDRKFLCRAAAASTGDYNAVCQQSSNCKSGACVTSGTTSGWCSKRCCSSKDCEDVVDRCEPLDVGSGNIVNICLTVPSDVAIGGTRLGGAVCSRDDDCRGAKCENGRCTDTCCRDDDCAEGTFCRPKKESFGYSLRCVVPE